MEKLQKLKGFKRTFPIQNDVRYRGNSYDPKSPYVPKGNYAVATNIVAVDGSGDFEDIQSAIDALPAGGGVVYIKEGNYNISSTITINKSNVSLIGAGRSTILYLVANSDCNVIEASKINTVLTGIKISDLQINGNKSNQGSGDFHGIALYGYVGYEMTNAIIQNVWVHNCDYNGLRLFSNINTSLLGNHLSDNDNAGILIRLSEYIIISNNQANSNLHGIWLYACDYNIITGNQANSNTYSGIVLNKYGSNKSDNNVITGNQANSNGYDGIVLADSDYNILIGNITTGNTNYGIAISDSDSTNTLAVSNYCTGNTAGNIQNNGTGTIIKDNVGYNPVGVSAISIGASPFTYTAGASPETVYIRAGTVSNITKSGTSLFVSTGHPVDIEPNQSIIVTYSALPTMIKDIH